MIRKYKYITKVEFDAAKINMAEALTNSTIIGNYMLVRRSDKNNSACLALGTHGKEYTVLENWADVMVDGWDDADDIIAPWHKSKEDR